MRRRTKIIATLGPATDENSGIEKMIRAGIDLVRINFSHGNLSDKKGINRRGGGLSAGALTAKDHEDLKAAAAMQLDVDVTDSHGHPDFRSKPSFGNFR